VTVASSADREAKLAADLLRELERFSAPEPSVADAGPVQLSLADFHAAGRRGRRRAGAACRRVARPARARGALADDDDDDADEATQARTNDRAAAASNDGDDDTDDESSDGEGARDDSDIDKRAPPKPTTVPSASPPGAPPGEPAYSDEQMALLRITQDVDFLFLSAETDDVVRYGVPPPNSGLSGDAVELMALATLPKLIERLTDSGEPDARLALHLLSTYSVFSFSTPSLPRAQCTPQMLFRLLKMRYFLGSLTADVGAELSRAGQQAVAVLCRLWTVHSATDFLDDGALLAEIDHFVHEDIPSTGGQVPRALVDAIDILRRAIATPLVTLPNLDALGPQAAPRITTKTMSVELVAQQLTLMEWHMLRAIRPSELLRQAWSRPGAQSRAPNVVRYMRWYNNVRAWAASEVLRGSTPVTRAVALRKLIRVTTALFELRNFNGVMELLSALNAAPVFRLRRTWDLLKPRDVQHFNALNRALDPADDYARYRPLLAAARAERQACVPFLGAILADLVELDERWPDTLPGSDLIVLDKMHAVGEVVVALRDAMKPTYAQLAVDERARSRLLAVQGSSDAELVRLSHQLEPPLRSNTLTRQARAKPSRGSLTKSTSSPRTPTAATSPSSRPTRPGATSSPVGASAAQSATLTEALVAAWEADNAAAESSPDVRGGGGAAAPERAARRVASLGIELDNRAFTRLALATEPLHRDDTYKVVSLGGAIAFEKGEQVWCERNPQVRLMRVRKGALRIMAGVGVLESPDKVKDVFGGSVLAPGTFFGAFDLVLGDVDVGKNGVPVATAPVLAEPSIGAVGCRRGDGHVGRRGRVQVCTGALLARSGAGAPLLPLAGDAAGRGGRERGARDAAADAGPRRRRHRAGRRRRYGDKRRRCGRVLSPLRPAVGGVCAGDVLRRACRQGRANADADRRDVVCDAALSVRRRRSVWRARHAARAARCGRRV
jgi:hypothetical protein